MFVDFCIVDLIVDFFNDDLVAVDFCDIILEEKRSRDGRDLVEGVLKELVFGFAEDWAKEKRVGDNFFMTELSLLFFET